MDSEPAAREERGRMVSVCVCVVWCGASFLGGERERESSDNIVCMGCLLTNNSSQRACQVHSERERERALYSPSTTKRAANTLQSANEVGCERSTQTQTKSVLPLGSARFSLVCRVFANLRWRTKLKRAIQKAVRAKR